MSDPRVYKIRRRAKLTRRLLGRVSRSTLFSILFFTLLATVLYSGSFASSFHSTLRSRQPEAILRGEDKLIKSRNNASKDVGNQLRTEAVTASLPSLTSAMLAPPDELTPEITTYAADCVTPKKAFNFGDSVCAKIDGGPPLSVAPRRFSWVSPDNMIQSRIDVTMLPQTDIFQIPARDPDVDYRGVWRVNSISPRSSVRASAFFTVSDPNDAEANLVVYNSVNTDASNVVDGSNVEFAVWMTNRGPDPALNVQLTDVVAANATFLTSAIDSSPATNPADFSCNPSAGGVTCTIARLEAGESARIRVVYQTTDGAAVGTIISNTATISGSTQDNFRSDNSATAQLAVTRNSAAVACSLVCPGNITKVADSTLNGQSGAAVTFGTGEVTGDCGGVTANPASGSFFPVGTTTVTLNSDSGQSCTFNVTVTSAGTAPSISCPAPVTKEAGSDCTASITAQELGTPTATGGSGELTFDGERSDGAGIDAPYPVGTTTIKWTVTDEASRSDSCNQVVTVTGNDTTPPTITAPSDVTDTTGLDPTSSCGKIIGETELGTPTTDDNCSSAVTVHRTGVPAGSFFPIGTTIITYTATDASGNTSQPVQQRVTITDNTPPVIVAPANASYVCPSEVPAANPSQATAPYVDANGVTQNGPPSDNCGTPIVTVSETSSGAGSASNPKIILRTFTATDSAGNSSSATQTITVADGTPPTISCPANIITHLPLNSTATSMPVTFAATASDNCAAPVITYSQASGSSFPVGTTSVTATATDGGGNTASCTFTVTVLYNFTGFFSPVNNLPTLNAVNAGRAIPVKFSLSGNKGLSIFAANSPSSGPFACGSNDPAVDLTDTVTAGSSSLNYDASSDQYNYVWKTESSWAGTCRQLVVTLKDGSVYRANFKFK